MSSAVRATITSQSLFFILTSMRIAVIVVSMPAISQGNAFEDAWASALLAMLVTIPVAYLGAWASARGGEAGFLASVRQRLGVLGVLLVVPLVVLTAVVPGYFSAQLAVLFATVALTETPQGVLVIVALLFGGYAASLGIGALGRIAQPVFVLLVLLLAFSIAGTAGAMDTARLLPHFSRGPIPIIQSAALPAAWTVVTLSVVLILSSRVRPARGVKGAAVLSTIIAGILLTAMVASVIMAFSAQEASQLLSPAYNLAKIIVLPQTLQRLEVVVLSAWISALCLKIAVFIFAASEAISQITGLRSYTNVVWPLVAANVVLAQVLFFSAPIVRDITEQALPYVAGVALFALPTIAAALIGKSRRGGSDGPKNP